MPGRSRIVLGLMSGTSADGVDAVACEIAGRGLGMKVRYLDHVSHPYPPLLRERILAAMAPAATRTEELCRLDVDIGRVFAEAAAALIRRLGRQQVDLIGSHGQTICHLPPGKAASNRAARSSARPEVGQAKVGRARVGRASVPAKAGRDACPTVFGTFQIGDPATIAVRTRTPVVSHFRQADMAAGGQGAPLVPWTDWVLFHDKRRNRVIQNIGGIANLTWLRAGGGPEDVIAFDTGSGNMVIDALVRHFTNGKMQYDRDGRMAARGRLDERLLQAMSFEDYLLREPPKSCGREQFGEAYVRGLLRRLNRLHLRAEDWIAAATETAAETMVMSYALHLPAAFQGPHRLHEIILCGGGARNPTLVKRLRAYAESAYEGVEQSTTDDHGIPSRAKEGLSFAMLAAACIDRVPANLPQVTGAQRPVVLGQVGNPEHSN